jgi:hypothetical protein
MSEALLAKFVEGLHPSTTLLSTGKATVMGHTVAAVEVRNLYNQTIVWGVFDVDRGKYKGKRMANNANTDGVVYERPTT